MKNKKIVSLLLTGVMTAALLASPAQAAPPAVRVGSYKGNTLNTGEVSGLMIYPNTAGDSVVSSDPDVVRVGNVLGHWTATAQSPGTAAITVTAPDGGTGSVTITVVSAETTVPGNEENAAAYSEVRLELIRLINQTRTTNGVPELPVSEALMNAAQVCSDSQYTWHHTKEECEAVIASGYPHGFGINLTVFTGVSTEDAAQHALDNWINTPGHYETMIKPNCDGIGVGVTENGGVTYCYMIIGRPNTHNPYE